MSISTSDYSLQSNDFNESNCITTLPPELYCGSSGNIKTEVYCLSNKNEKTKKKYSFSPCQIQYEPNRICNNIQNPKPKPKSCKSVCSFLFQRKDSTNELNLTPKKKNSYQQNEHFEDTNYSLSDISDLDLNNSQDSYEIEEL